MKPGNRLFENENSYQLANFQSLNFVLDSSALKYSDQQQFGMCHQAHVAKAGEA